MIKFTIFIVIAVISTLVWANFPSQTIAPGTFAERIVVWKSKRQLDLYAHGRNLKSFRISLGRNPVGSKLKEGDKRTPEGTYVIRSHNAMSSCYKALKISYPSAADRFEAAKLGFTPGGDIMIHGIKNGLGFLGRLHRLVDWTSGCIAVTDFEMDEIYRVVPDGTPIEIHP